MVPSSLAKLSHYSTIQGWISPAIHLWISKIIVGNGYCHCYERNIEFCRVPCNKRCYQDSQQARHTALVSHCPVCNQERLSGQLYMGLSNNLMNTSYLIRFLLYNRHIFSLDFRRPINIPTFCCTCIARNWKYLSELECTEIISCIIWQIGKLRKLRDSQVRWHLLLKHILDMTLC